MGTGVQRCPLPICTRVGGAEKNPGDECNPQATEAGSAKEAKNTEKDETVCDDLSGCCSRAGGLGRIACDPPDDPAEYATAVKREARHHVENGQSKVDV